MTDRDKALAALAAKEERVEIDGVVFILREFDSAAEVAALRDGTDAQWKLLVRSCFRPDGEPYFTDLDIPALKKRGLARIKRLIEAAMRVNGELIDPEVKNSAAAPGGG